MTLDRLRPVPAPRRQQALAFLLGAGLAANLGAHEGALQALGDDAPSLPGAEPFDARELRPAAPATMAPQQGGQWSPVMDWPLVAIHAALLPNGSVLAWDATPDDADDDPHTTDNYTTRVTLWDPVAGTHVATNNDTDTDLFCAGSAHLWDGRILFAGGDGARAGANGPLANSNIYDPATNTWRRTENMHAPRWYSSVAALPNGEMLTFGGNYSPDPVAEVFDLDRNWRALPLATGRDWRDDYQWIQSTPEGSVLSFGPQNLIAEIETDGAGSFTELSTRDQVDYRDYGSYAMFDVGKILVAGGGNSVDTAVVIDTRTRQVSDSGRMNIGRRQHNLTILADGSVLVTGGNSDGTRNISLDAGVFTPELWDPATGAFTPLNPMNADRQYHSVALLLQDGRVLSAGGGICGDCYAVGYEERNGAVFSPPYLFADDGSLAERPQLSGLPAEADYAQTLSAAVDGPAALVRAHLIKLGSTTHSENQDQRLVPLTLRVDGSQLQIELPNSRDIAPPGHYLLIGVDARGVPSPGAMLKLGQPLVRAGQAVTSTLEPGAWDHYLVPATDRLDVELVADMPVELYVAEDRATGPGRLAAAECRAASIGSNRQSCTVTGDGEARRWYVSVHGATRGDYRLSTRGTPAEEPAPVPLSSESAATGDQDNQGVQLGPVTTGGGGAIGLGGLLGGVLGVFARRRRRRSNDSDGR